MLKTPQPSSAAVAGRSPIDSSTGIAPSADLRHSALLLSAECLYRYLATAFAGLADEQAVKHHLYACFGIPMLHGDMEIARQVSPEFAAEVANLGTHLRCPPVSAEAWLQARACWPRPCFTPHEVHLAMAGVLFAAQTGTAAFCDTAELDLAQFRDFLVAHFGPVDAALMDIPLTALESCLITGALPDKGATPEPGDAAALAAAELARQMWVRLGTMPALFRHRQHGQSFDVLVQHAGQVQHAAVIVNIPLCLQSPGVERPREMEVCHTAAPAPPPTGSPAPMNEVLWISGTPVWPASPEGHPREIPAPLPEAPSLPDQKQLFEHWYATIPEPRQLLVDFARCVRDGSICHGNVLAIARLIHAPPPALLFEHVRQTGLLPPEMIHSLEAQRALRHLVPGVLFVLASGFMLQPQELAGLDARDLRGNAACMTLLWNLSADSQHASSTHDIVRLSGLPLAHAVATRATGLELPHSHSYQWLWQIIEQRMLPQLNTFLAALQRVPPRALVLETLAQIFKAVVDLADQQHAYDILACFHRHQLLAPEICRPADTETRATTVPLLPYVMAAGKFDLARWLLSLPFDVNLSDPAGRTALHYAAGAGQTDIVNSLLYCDARLHVIDDHGRTPLHAAAQGCHVEAMQAMLTWPEPAVHTVLLHVRDGGGCTPVDLALRHGQAGHGPRLSREAQVVVFCAMLLAHSPAAPGLLIEAIDRVDATLFQRLCGTCLSRNGMANTPFLRMTDAAGRTPLLRALAARRLDIAGILLEEGADILYTSPIGNALHIWLSAWREHRGEAAKRRMLSGLEMLLRYAERRSLEESMAWINSQSRLGLRDGEWHSIPPPLHMACEYQLGGAVALLLARGADPMLRTRFGQSMLEVALSGALQDPKGGKAYIEKLYRCVGELRWKLLVNAPNFDGITPLRALLRRLADSGQPPSPEACQLIDFLCVHGAMDYPDIPGQPHVATRARFSAGSWGRLHAVLPNREPAEAYAVLRDDPASVNDINEAGQTPLMLAVAKDKRDLVRTMLCTDGLDVMARDALGRTALHYAAQYGRFEIVCMLAAKEPRLCHIKGGLYLQVGRTANMTPLHVAARGDHRRIVDFLLSQDVMPMVLDGEDGNFLHQAASHGALEVLQLLIHSYPELLSRLLVQRTALHKLTPIEYALHHRVSVTPDIAERIDEACKVLCAFLEERRRMTVTSRPHRPGEDLRGRKPLIPRGRPPGCGRIV